MTGLSWTGFYPVGFLVGQVSSWHFLTGHVFYPASFLVQQVRTRTGSWLDRFLVVPSFTAVGTDLKAG